MGEYHYMQAMNQAIRQAESPKSKHKFIPKQKTAVKKRVGDFQSGLHSRSNSASNKAFKSVDSRGSVQTASATKVSLRTRGLQEKKKDSSHMIRMFASQTD